MGEWSNLKNSREMVSLVIVNLVIYLYTSYVSIIAELYHIYNMLDLVYKGILHSVFIVLFIYIHTVISIN